MFHIDIKICGITTIEAAHVAVQAGATMIGFVFAPSNRRISVDQAKEIIQSLPQSVDQSVEKVGVFVNESVHHMQSIAKKVGLTMFQLHGEESVEDMQKMTYPIIKAVSIDHINKITIQGYPPDFYLIDSPPAQFKGGTGTPFDWSILEKNTPLLQDFIVAGGLTPENVHEAIIRTKCTGVDVSSGVETNGIKDHKKIRSFIQAAIRAKGEVQ